MQTLKPFHLFLAVAALTGCADPEFDDTGRSEAEVAELVEKALSGSARRAREKAIRDSAARVGLHGAALVAGIASAETGMAHCWSEATWACKGPWSADCNGPVIAGAGDGPCWWEEGGLGMFQFDAGTFDATLRREGNSILRLDGNIAAGVDFVADMLVRSAYVNVYNRSDALRWLGDVRPGAAGYDAWIKTVTHYYNGCVPGRCGVYSQRYAHYDHHARLVWSETGAAFWGQSSGGGSSPAPRDDPAPRAGDTYTVPAGGSCWGASQALGCSTSSLTNCSGWRGCQSLWAGDVLACNASACDDGVTPDEASTPEPAEPSTPSCETYRIPAGGSCGQVERALGCSRVVNCTANVGQCGDVWAYDVLACSWDCCP